MRKNIEPLFAATELTPEDTRRFVASAEELTKEITATRESALEFLVRLGTHTRNGKLTKDYR